MMHWNSIRRNNVVVRGNGERTLVLAHGFGCDQNMWRWLEPHLDGFRLILFDYTGCGASDLSDFDTDRHSRLQSYAEDLGEICEALDLRDVTLIGHSVSGLIGLMSAIAAPARFARLVMVCPSPCFFNLPGYSGGFERCDLEELIALMDRNYIGWANHLAPLAVGQPAGSDLSDALTHSFCSTDPVTARTFAEATFLSDHRDLLGHAVHPTLIIQSARDALASPTVGRYMRDAIPDSRLEVVDADGHCLHMTHPGRVAQLIREFVGKAVDADALPRDPFGIDRFPMGCLATDGSRTIRFANDQVARQVKRSQAELLGSRIETLLTPASRIFCESYVYPLLLTKGRCDEIALTVATGSGERMPVVANACMHREVPELVLWSVMRADRRDKLQNEVLSARNQLHKQTRLLNEMATRDALTGLWNRREATRRIEAPFSAADRAGASVTVLLLDIDRFKAVNDTHGHQAGDEVLRQFGAALADPVRLHEVVGRYGGEEFILAIAADGAEGARSLNQRLHAAVACVTGQGAPVTISIGLCCRPPQSGRSFESIVNTADAALYQAKALGRNRSMIEIDGRAMPFD